MINIVKEIISKVYHILDLYMPILKSIGGKVRLRDYVVEKGSFLMLGMVGIMGAKDG